jgi:hypothetical protein
VGAPSIQWDQNEAIDECKMMIDRYFGLRGGLQAIVSGLSGVGGMQGGQPAVRAGGVEWRKADDARHLDRTRWVRHLLHADLTLFIKRLVARTGFEIKRTSALETLDLRLIRVFGALGINCVLDGRRSRG